MSDSPYPFAEAEDGDVRRETIGSRNNRTGPTTFTQLSYNYIASSIMRQLRKENRSSCTRRSQRLDTAIFFKLPLELVYEILGNLHPIDLYHLGLSGKPLRRIVMSQHALSLWKASFAHHPEVPSCPSVISEPKWAAMLFRPDTCEACGSHGAMIDFTFRTQYCMECMLSKCTYRIVDGQSPYALDHLVWDLIPSTRRIGNSYMIYDDKPWNTKYLIEDVSETVNALKAFELEIASGHPGATEAFEAFKSLMLQRTREAMKHADICNKWAHDTYNKFYDAVHRERSRMAHLIITRLERLGFELHSEDKYAIQHLVYSKKKRPKLTRNGWNMILEHCIKQFELNRQGRIIEERRAVIRSRERRIAEAYSGFLREQPPRAWEQLPTSGVILRFEPISKLVNLPTDVFLQKSDIDEAIKALPGLISAWTRQTKEALALEAAASVHLHSTPLDDTDAVLDFATSVFTCPGCCQYNRRCFVGQQDLLIHVHCTLLHARGSRLAFSPRGSVAASSLLQVLNWDLSAKAKDLDKLDARFICAKCPARRYDGAYGHLALTWRECIIHAIEMDAYETHSSLSWRLLTPEATNAVLLREEPYPHPTARSWSCGHCSTYLHQLVTRRKAIKHVKLRHNVTRPVDDVDFFYHGGTYGEWTSRKPVCISEDSAAQFRCGRCTSSTMLTRSEFMLFSAEDLMAHLSDEHGVQSWVEGEDWKKIRLFV